jgi:hypothetical protein
VISKKMFFIDYLDELGLFIGEKPIFKKIYSRRSTVCRDFMAVQMKNFVRPLFERCFERIGLTGVNFHF